MLIFFLLPSRLKRLLKSVLIDLCCENAERNEGLSTIEYRKLLSLATKESYFVFNRKLYKQVDGIAVGSPLFPALTTFSFIL